MNPIKRQLKNFADCIRLGNDKKGKELKLLLHHAFKKIKQDNANDLDGTIDNIDEAMKTTLTILYAWPAKTKKITIEHESTRKK